MTGRRCCLYFIYQRNAGADREPDDQEAEGGKAAHKRAEAGAIERRAEHEAEGAQDYLGDFLMFAKVGLVFICRTR